MTGRLFPVGRLAGPEDVVDREDFLERITAEILSGQSVMIAGPRRIGKSSVAHEILRRLRAAGHHTAAVDLFYTGTLEALGASLLQAVLEARSGVQPRLLRTWQEIKTWIQQITLRQNIGDFEITLPLRTDPLSAEEMIALALSTAERIAAKDDCAFVILFDEFQEVDVLGGTPLLKRLRAIFQQQERCTYLFLGSQTSLLETLFADRRAAFYRFAKQYQLPPIPPDAWADYLTEKFASVGLSITSTAVAAILDETGGHPYGVMQVANAAYVRARLSEAREISAELIAIVLDEVLDSLDATYSEVWEQIRKFRHAGRLVTGLMEGKRPYSVDLDAGTVSRLLTVLQEMAVLRRHGRGDYAFVEPLFERWLRRKWQRREVH